MERFERRARPATASARPKLKKFLLRYYPPGIVLEYEHAGELMQRSVDLLDLVPDTDADTLVNAITAQESMIKESHREPLRKLVKKLQAKLRAVSTKSFALVNELRAHILPLTNCAFNKSGDSFITGSYDRTCKVRRARSLTALLSGIERHVRARPTSAHTRMGVRPSSGSRCAAWRP